MADSVPPLPLRVLMMVSVRWYNACAAYAVETAASLAGAGHEVEVLVKPGSPAENEARSRGLRVHAAIDLTAPARAFTNLRALRRIIETFRPQAVNAHRSEDHLLAAFALRGSTIPLIRTRGDVRPPRRHLANRVLYRRATAAHIACADFMPSRFYAGLGIDPDAIYVIRPGLDVDGFRGNAPDRESARRTLGLDPGMRWIGAVGRFTEGKGLLVLLRAFAGLRASPLPGLYLSGDEVDLSAERIRTEAASLGVADRVRLGGRGDDVRVPLCALDILAIPSLQSEAISRIALEGMSLGVPTVASALNALPEVVGDAGLLVPPGDHDALRGALCRMLGEPELRARFAEAGPRRVRRRYDRAVQAALTGELLAEVAAAAGGGRARG